ncbi:MAG: class I SAM-dependent methyltransferase, partial [Candidatus Methanomethylophilaceae archaeon]
MISIEGLENPERQRELDPNGSLKRAGICDNSIVCDIGAGTGAFTFPAAKISKGPVYALDVLDEMLDFIESKKKKLGIDNIVTRKVTSERLPIDDGECDIALMVTVLHDIDDKETMMSEVRRL